MGATTANPRESTTMKILTVLFAALFALFAASWDAEAKRLGGGRSLGAQRTPMSPQRATPSVPASQPQQTAPAAPSQQPSAAGRWLAPLAGLALGAGLASLFFNNGLAGALAGLLMLTAVIAGIALLVRLLRARGPAPAGAQYAGAGPGSPAVSTRYDSGGAAPYSVAATSASCTSLPPDFDAVEFVRHAKRNFVRLQAANDAGDLAALRDVLAPSLYREIELEVRARGTAPQDTEVVTLEAEVLEVETEGELHRASVRFSGLLRESENEPPQAFGETWHLEKPVRGDSGWLVAGIQQD